MPSDDELLKDFFGTDQVDKLNLFKKSLEDEKTKKEEEEKQYEALLRKNVKQKLQIPVNPNRKSARYSCDVVSEMEDLRARLHQTAFKELEEFDKKFSPKLTHPGINPASGESSHSRQSSLDSSHLAAGSSPQLMQVHHRRDHSLPVYMDPSSTGSPQSGSSNSSPFTSRSATQLLRNQGGAGGGGGGEGEMNDRSPTPPFQYGHIRQLSAGSTSSGSGTFSPPPNAVVTSPTAKQSSPSFTPGGALSYNMPRYGGSGGALNRYQNYDQGSKLSGSSGALAGHGRAPNPSNPQFHSLKQSRTQQQPQHPVLKRTGSSGVTGGGGVGGGASGLVTIGTNLSLTRPSSAGVGRVSRGGGGGASGGGGGVAGGGAGAGSGESTGLVIFGTNLSLKRNATASTTNTSTNNSSLNRIRNAVPLNSQQVLPNPASNGVTVVRRQDTSTGSTQTHYSTAVIKKRRSNPSPDGTGTRNRRSSGGEDFQAANSSEHHHHHQSRNGYPSAGSGNQMLSANMNHNNLGSSGSDVSILVPEQKDIPKTAQQGRLMAPHEKISGSPRMARKPLVQKGTSGIVIHVSSASSQNSRHQKRPPSPVLRKSEPNPLEGGKSSSSIYPENIEPYMSTGDAKGQMQFYKYTPYTDGGSKAGGGKVDTSSTTPESTWC